MNFQALFNILATKDKVINMNSVEGLTSLINEINPLAFTATTDNNPNILSQSAMLCSSNCTDFVISQ